MKGTKATAMYPFEAERVIVEVVSATICFLLVKFMINPYRLTREGRYLGLPLGFGILGVSYVIAAIVYSPLFSNPQVYWLALLTRTFAFVFLATTYVFSSVNSKKGQIIGEIMTSILAITLAVLLLLAFVAPQFATEGYYQANEYLRVLNVICLAFISIRTLQSHIRNPDPKTILIPFGFIFLTISQYSLLFWYFDSSYSAWIGSLVTRCIGLAVFLFVALRAFYGHREERDAI